MINQSKDSGKRLPGDDYLAQATTKQFANPHHLIERPQDSIKHLPNTTPLINSAYGYTNPPTYENDYYEDMVEITSMQFYGRVEHSEYGGKRLPGMKTLGNADEDNDSNNRSRATSRTILNTTLDFEPEGTYFTITQAPEEVFQQGFGLPFETPSSSLPQQVEEFSAGDLARGVAIADFVAKHPESQEAKDWKAIDLSGDAEFLGLFKRNG